MQEKDVSEIPANNQRRERSQLAFRGLLAVLAFCGFYQFFHLFPCTMWSEEPLSVSFSASTDSTDELLCPLYDKIEFKDPDTSVYILHDDEFRNKSISRLSKAVQIPTWIDDEGSDFTRFTKFHEYLETEFQRVFDAANVFKVNTYGIVLEFKGSNSSLKPAMFTAHQDTVPPGDPQNWDKDPFSGLYDGTRVYGRGASDCKNLLIGLLESMDYLLEKGFKPERTIIFAFGFDEESSGKYGASHISKFLLERYGPKSLYHIIDEGFGVFMELQNRYFAMLATGEKGYLDLGIEVLQPGGHSSIPPDHTAIGTMSKLISRYEDRLYDPILVNFNPTLNTLQCIAEYADIEKSLKRDILRAHFDEKSNERVIKLLLNNKITKYNVLTTHAADIINGGDKANALPQNVTALINHRIAHGNGFDTIMDRVTGIATGVAQEHRMGLIVDDEILIEPTLAGSIKIKALYKLAVAPVTPINDEIWASLAGHYRTFYEDITYPEKFEDDVLVLSAGIMTGNTDTRHYWDLTDHIFRGQPGFTPMTSGVHGNNEYVDADSHLQVVAFYYNYILSIS
ncbi:hypothetical protein KL930_000246 [Ogataea haglerorum]|uniref:Peptidase M20 dimerisation domain-containing protein n=1 Tax=Ogataea haglerorum TaxID=1937702 RepID=A0ABQ7REK6_9ASCO|nr:hypothetical protein KL950_003184 [Ogataea haglerorum]KAG7709258.1 hypothetical protein KL914_001648 [Ogataea haglerorum]KAG7741837.1 hypothetical protein KL923_001092 [Ogataea haglerorum]KAG7742327.1 hypothetical protein KL932_002469 [Ogataea haglerorum]KAG7764145.1 hypothetical protein KL946_003585 [Ogataea haglerorum]